MSDIPDTILGKIQFFEQHIPVWAADPAAIGLSAQQIVDITSLTAAARISYNDTQSTRQAAKNATVIQTDAVSGMMGFGTALVATIKAFADANGDDQNVYALAGISPDNGPTPVPPPVPAINVTADLLNSGEIKLRWKGTTANGTFYAIWRRLNAGETFDLLGSVSAKSFVDTTIPVGTPEATYFLRTHRDELSSDDSEPITVRFGAVGLTDGNQNETAGNDGLGLAA